MKEIVGTKLSKKSKWNGNCLEYLGGFNSTAEGKRCLKYNGKKQLAHRVAFYEANGYMPKQVNHTCHNPACINPDHLYDGNQSENMEDMAWAGRHPLWSTDWKRVFQVKQLRKQGLTQEEVGAKLGITQTAVSHLERKYESSTEITRSTTLR